MLEIFSHELEAKEQASLTVKKGYEKSRENYTTGETACSDIVFN